MTATTNYNPIGWANRVIKTHKARSIAPDFYRVVENQVRLAVARDENRLEDGSINWNFVDADCYMAINPTSQCRNLYMELFDEACEAVEKEMEVA